jgi:hypothetical protein
VINHRRHNQNAVIVERTNQQVIKVARLLKPSKYLRDNRNKPKQQMKTNKIVRVVPKQHRPIRKPIVRWYLTLLLKLNML